MAQVSAVMGAAVAGSLLGCRPVTLAAGATAGNAAGVMLHRATYRYGGENILRVSLFQSSRNLVKHRMPACMKVQAHVAAAGMR